jgi:hypothetical protein
MKESTSGMLTSIIRGKRIAAVCAAALLMQHGAFGQNPGDNVFAGIQVHTINIRFPQQHYWDSLTIYYSQGNEQYIPATVIIDGTTCDSVGVRLKGNSSYNHPNNKKSIRLAMDQYRGDQRWDGLKSVHLNNCFSDPTLMREKIHLDFCRDAGVAAPRANYARVFINDTAFAFYSLVEHVDKKFLGTHYGDNSGDLFKAVDEFGTGGQYISNFRWYGSAQSAYDSLYELKTDGSTTAWPRLLTLLDTLNNSSTIASSLPAKVNVSSFERALAADILCGNLDSYVNSGRNFYFYFLPSTTKMEWIVWDAGLSFGGYPGGVTNPEALSLTYVVNAVDRPLVGKVLGTTQLKNEYLRTLCSVFTGYFSSSRLLPHIDSVANVIRSYVYEDQRKMYTNQQFETNIVSDITVSGSRKPGLKSFINLRQANVQTQLTSLGVTCAVNVSPGDVVINEFMAQNDSIADPSGEFEDWIELYNNTTHSIDLGGMYLSDDVSRPTKWQFPANSTIGANSYVMVWADEDSGQVGLHANFQLSASGEYLRLSNTDASVLDSVTFGAQQGNRTMARIPNGTGTFFKCRPTIGGDNGNSLVSETEMTATILPQYIEGLNGTNTNRIPFVYRARLTGLTPKATYRFINQVVNSADAATTSGSGNCIFVFGAADFVRTSSPSLGTAGAYGSFTSDSTGAYEGWFINEPTGNARFVPGRYVFMRLNLNDGASGTTVALRVTTTDSVRVIKLDAAAGDSTGTGLRCTSAAGAKEFIFVYGNTTGIGRPVSGTFVESDGSANTTSNSYAAFYSNSVNGVTGAFGLILPNALATGVRRIDRRSLATGALIGAVTDGDGIWPSGANTVNPLGGTTEIVLSSTDVSPLTTVSGAEEIPSSFALAQNYPNPFNPTTAISFQLPAPSGVEGSAVNFVRLTVYDALGRQVATLVDGYKPAGMYTVNFDGTGLASGMYLYRLQAGAFVSTKKMLLMK